jgi:hypothetical protein
VRERAEEKNERMVTIWRRFENEKKIRERKEEVKEKERKEGGKGGMGNEEGLPRVLLALLWGTLSLKYKCSIDKMHCLHSSLASS